MHAGALWLITGGPVLAAVELALRIMIDQVRGREANSFNTDELLHILCKAAYVLVIILGVL